MTLFQSKNLVKGIVFLISCLIGLALYFKFFIDILPRFFGNMENIEKNILAALIIVVTTYILLLIVCGLDNAIERYVLVGCYVLVLILGLLRPDQQNAFAHGDFSLNPFGFISDIANDEASLYVMIINVLIFVPAYFLLSQKGMMKRFWSKLAVFAGFAILMEVLQHLLDKGLFDLSDIFLYTVGFFAGYVISLPVLKIVNKSSKQIVLENQS
jgi:VanZ like family